MSVGPQGSSHDRGKRAERGRKGLLSTVEIIDV